MVSTANGFASDHGLKRQQRLSSGSVLCEGRNRPRPGYCGRRPCDVRRGRNVSATSAETLAEILSVLFQIGLRPLLPHQPDARTIPDGQAARRSGGQCTAASLLWPTQSPAPSRHASRFTKIVRGLLKPADAGPGAVTECPRADDATLTSQAKRKDHMPPSALGTPPTAARMCGRMMARSRAWKIEDVPRSVGGPPRSGLPSAPCA